MSTLQKINESESGGHLMMLLFNIKLYCAGSVLEQT